MDNDPYTRDEVESLGDSKPTRGAYCPKCKSYIPSFADLTPELADRIKRMDARQGMLELQRITGCSRLWAKSWFVHRNGPHREFGESDAPDCPECGEQLRTKLAKQCVVCGADWH